MEFSRSAEGLAASATNSNWVVRVRGVTWSTIFDLGRYQYARPRPPRMRIRKREIRTGPGEKETLGNLSLKFGRGGSLLRTGDASAGGYGWGRGGWGKGAGAGGGVGGKQHKS